MPSFDAAGVAVYALSYDEPDALADFRDAHAITYTLLSDPDSEVIRAFGILNTLIDPDDHPWFGIPFPGTFVSNEAGVITHKFFDNNLAVRAGPEQLLNAALGEEALLDPTEGSEPEGVEVSIALDGDSLTSTVQKDLIAHFNVPAGRHVYADPAPVGSVGVDLVLDESPGLVTRPIERPASETHTLEGSDETFQVHHGRFELRLPLTVNSLARSGAAAITITGEARWQSCDDVVCDIPSAQRFELTVPVTKPPANAIGSKKGETLEPNAKAHFRRMTERRRQP